MRRWICLLVVCGCMAFAAERPDDRYPFERAMRGQAMAQDSGKALLAAPKVVTDIQAVVATHAPVIDFIPTGPIHPHGQGNWFNWGDHGGEEGRCSASPLGQLCCPVHRHDHAQRSDGHPPCLGAGNADLHAPTGWARVRKVAQLCR